jgi:flagellar hook-associated protein 1 FlgK
MSTFGGIYSVRSGLDAARRALDVVGQNVSNANTNGYTRQEVSFVSADPTKVIRSAGRGISEVNVLRYRDEFLDRQYRNRTGLQGFFDTLSTQMGQVEQVMGDLSETGLRNAVDQFFNTWDTLSAHPTDPSARAQVVSAAQGFIEMAKDAFGQLQTLRANADEAIQSNVNDINSAEKQLADLNQEIMKQEIGGRQTANDLRDQRDRLLDSLAKLAGTTNVVHEDGTATVYLGTLPLVDKQSAYPIDMTTAMESDLDPSGLTSVQQKLTTLTWNGTTAPAVISSGSVAGLIAVRDKVAPQYMKYLDNLVRTVATQVNTLHTAADTAGNPQIGFFTDSTGDPLLGTNKWMDIQVNAAIVADPSKIVAAGTVPGIVIPPATTPPPPAANDGERALSIARLRDQAIMSGAPVGTRQVTASEYLRSVSSQLGIAVAQAQSQSEAAALQVSQADKQRQSVSGVSLDDEMTKMIQFQQTYNAAARMMTTMDEMLDVVVNRVGLVGR